MAAIPQVVEELRERGGGGIRPHPPPVNDGGCFVLARPNTTWAEGKENHRDAQNTTKNHRIKATKKLKEYTEFESRTSI